MIYLLSFIIVLGIPVFLHELGHFLAAKSVGIKVEKFYVGFNLFNLGIKKKYKGTEYGIGLFPLGGYVKVAGIVDENMDLKTKGKDYEFRSKNVFQKVWFLSAGVIMNFVLAIIVFSSITFFEGLPKIVNEPIISSVHQNISEEDESPAYKIGLKKDDRIISINNTNISSFIHLQDIIKKNYNDSLIIEWERENKLYSGTIKPVEINKFEKGKIISIGVIGISPYVDMIETGFFGSIFEGINVTTEWTKTIYYSLVALISGNVSMDQLSGPLGIARVAGETALSDQGFYKLIILMAIISINLGLINILPLPVVDGGHVVIAVIEGILRRELPLKLKYSIQIFGTLLLISLFVFVFINDIRNFL